MVFEGGILDEHFTFAFLSTGRYFTYCQGGSVQGWLLSDNIAALRLSLRTKCRDCLMNLKDGNSNMIWISFVYQMSFTNTDNPFHEHYVYASR